MKTFYLVMSVLLTVLILILGFENIGSSCSNLMFFFFPIDSNPTIVILGIAVMGILTGAFYHAFIQKLLNSTEEDEENTAF